MRQRGWTLAAWVVATACGGGDVSTRGERVGSVHVTRADGSSYSSELRRVGEHLVVAAAQHGTGASEDWSLECFPGGGSAQCTLFRYVRDGRRNGAVRYSHYYDSRAAAAWRWREESYDVHPIRDIAVSAATGEIGFAIDDPEDGSIIRAKVNLWAPGDPPRPTLAESDVASRGRAR